jgi:hypothetical protein
LTIAHPERLVWNEKGQKFLKICRMRIVASPRLAAVVGACAALSLFCAPPALADEAGYLKNLQAKYPYLSSGELLSAGQGACAFIESGRPSADAMEKVASELNVSATAAFDIVVGATWHLGC